LSKTHIFTGKIYWAKVLADDFGPAYEEGDPDKWSFDLALDDNGVAEWKKIGFKKTVKNKGGDRGDYVSFERAVSKADGTPSKPFAIVGPDLREWDQSVKIGNGSIVNVKLTVNEREYKGKKMLVPGVLEIQVWEHVEYSDGKVSFKAKTASKEW